MAMQRTRRQIIEYLKRHGPATLEELSRAIGLVPATLRMHLNVLGREQLVTFEEVRGKVGRPAFHYSLSARAEQLFPKRYDVLARRLLEKIEQTSRPEQLDRLWEHVAERWAEERGAELRTEAPRQGPRAFSQDVEAPGLKAEGDDAAPKLSDLERRLDEVARLRCQEGSVTEWERTPDGYLLHEYNCASAHLRDELHRVCEIEQRYLERLLGVAVQRLSCCGDDRPGCTYLVVGSAS